MSRGDQLCLKVSSFLPIALQLQGDPVIDLLEFVQWQDCVAFSIFEDSF